MKIIGNFDGSLADITSVVAGTGLSGGGTTGAVTLNVDAAQTQITSVGTIGTGTWQGTAIGASYIATLNQDTTGQAATVATIAGLAPNTATTQATQPAIESIGTDGDTLSVLGDRLDMINTTTSRPQIRLVNNTDDATGPLISFWNQRLDSGTQDGEDDDVLGTFTFSGYDDGTPTQQTYAKIYSDIHDATSDEESGRLTFQVANHDGGLGSGLILTGGSANNEIDVTVGLGASSIVTMPGMIEAQHIDLQHANAAITFDAVTILSDSSGTATLSNIDALDATTVATIQAAATHSQFINLSGYATLEDGNYLFAQDFVDNKSPWLLSQDYTSGTINSSTELQQRFFFKTNGFHVPVACVINAIQVQGSIDGSGGGNMTVAVVEYKPSEHADNRNDYPRTVYEEVVVGSNNHSDKVKTVSVASGDLDATAITAGSHLLIMVKGDGDTDGDNAVVSVAIEIRW